MAVAGRPPVLRFDSVGLFFVRIDKKKKKNMGCCFGKPGAWKFRKRTRMARVYPTQDWHLEQKRQRVGLTKKSAKKRTNFVS